MNIITGRSMPPILTYERIMSRLPSYKTMEADCTGRDQVEIYAQLPSQTMSIQIPNLHRISKIDIFWEGCSDEGEERRTGQSLGN
jgi:hypothetical protein